jgi:type I restriction enzyme S subunit
MSGWRQTTTAELLERGIIEIGDGYRAKNAEFAENGGLPFVRVGNVGTRLQLDGLDELPLENKGRYGSKISRPFDSLITMKGTVGRVACVSENVRSFVYSPQISYWRSHDPTEVHPRWLRYWLESPEFLGQASATKGATDMADYINLRDQRRMHIALPPLQAQRQIADVLGALDDLIENNRRRIELLEEMAQAIYREWFVRFRYPGHEDAILVDSPFGPIPEGWEVKPFSMIASFVNGFAFKPTHWGNTGRPIIKIKELKQGVTADTPRCRKEEIERKYWVEPGDLLFSWSADLGAYRWSDEPGLLNQHLFTVMPSGKLSLAFLFRALDGAMPEFRERAQGTTMRHIRRSALSEVTVALPPQDLVDLFTAAVEPADREVISLRQSSHGLASMRDLLLPKLVTGQIDVSKLDFDVVVGSVA